MPHSPPPHSAIGSHSASGRVKHGLGWVPWAAGLLLLALVALVLLLAFNANDDDDRPGIDVRNDSAAAGHVVEVQVPLAA